MTCYLIRFVLFAMLVALTVGCADADDETCTQEEVDECYSSVGCEGSDCCTLNTDTMNALCACLTDLGCDQEWYHSYCDGAPYEEGECGECDEESDAGSD